MLLELVQLWQNSVAHPDITLQALRHGTCSLVSHSHLILVLDAHLQSVMRHLSLVVHSLSHQMAWERIPVIHLPTSHLVHVIVELAKLSYLSQLSGVLSSYKIVEVLCNISQVSLVVFSVYIFLLSYLYKTLDISLCIWENLLVVILNLGPCKFEVEVRIFICNVGLI